MNDTKVRPDAIGHIFVDTSRSKEAFERIDDLMVRGWEANFCRALLLLGPSRCGKTQIVAEWLRLRRLEQPSFKAVVSEVPPACTLANFASQLLTDMGDPDPDYGTQGDRTRRIHEFGRDIDLIVIDELQRLIDERTEKVKRDVANWLTNVLNRRICPLLLVGERTAEIVFHNNLYLSGRTLGQVPVEPYDWHEPEERLEFRHILKSLDRELGMMEVSGLSSPDLALRIHAFSGGRIGMAALLIDDTRALARRAGRSKMAIDLFAESVDRLRIGHTRREQNPFRVDKPVAGGLAPGHVRDVSGSGRPRAGREDP